MTHLGHIGTFLPWLSLPKLPPDIRWKNGLDSALVVFVSHGSGSQSGWSAISVGGEV